MITIGSVFVFIVIFAVVECRETLLVWGPKR